MEKESIHIFWFRRDLRTEDNRGFYKALTAGKPVLPVFIFDTAILNDLEDNDTRVSFILREIQKLQDIFERQGSSFWIFHGYPLEAFRILHEEYAIDTVFINQDYEPYAIARDRTVTDFLVSVGIKYCFFKDHVIFDRDDILSESGNPYTVYTPYRKKWKAMFSEQDLHEYPSQNHLHHLLKLDPLRKFHHADLGFRPGVYTVPAFQMDSEVLTHYQERRDFPAAEGTTRLGIYLRFGTVSIRKVTASARLYSETFLDELIWRNFYMDVLWHFPHVAKRSFKPAYDDIAWMNSEKDFARWCEGTTGYPMVDAGMRQLNETGYMHNRARMVVASFLCKHLLIDWRWGEAYFAEKLLDFELASNNGGWQWAAGSGCDAVPYFRIFNPELQQKKFDPQEIYIRTWIPEYGTDKYPKPITLHRTARERVLRLYRDALNRR